jgi:pyridoxamine 5'-phosphate oxidase family protein
MTSADARTFTEAELAYLAGQRLGRLATVAPDGSPQNSPVGFRVRSAGIVEIYGYDLAATRKFRNVAATGVASLVVDDIASVDPWQVRGVEIRGHAEALTDVDPPSPGLSRAVIRIRPRRIVSWGVDPDLRSMTARSVSSLA